MKCSSPLLDWKDQSQGIGLEIGKIETPNQTYSNYMYIRSAIINGKTVLFYYGSSTVVHHGWIKDWWKKHFCVYYDYSRWAHSDATNFGNLVSILQGKTEITRRLPYKDTIHALS